MAARVGAALALAVALASVPANARAQAAPTAKPGPGAAQAATAAATPAPPASPDSSAQGFSYEAASRRDPFVSLVRKGTDAAPTSDGRARGLAGLETGEVTLTGTLTSRQGFVGIVQGADSKTYIVRRGDKLLDGTITAVLADAMVILQQVDDPLTSQKQREVRKPLRHTEGAR